MDGKYHEKEALAAKLNSLTSLVDALKTSNNALKKLSKLGKEVHRKRNTNKSSENGTITKTKEMGLLSSSDGGTKMSDHNEKLNTSSDRLSKLAKETWKAKKITPEHNKINIDREKSKQTQSMHYFKEIPKISLETRKCQAPLHKKSKVVRKNSSCLLETNKKGNVKNVGMGFEKSDNTKSEESKGASFLSLGASSDRLSCIAKNTWRNAQKRRNFKHFAARNNDAMSTKFTGENSHEKLISNEQYKLNGSMKHRYRLNKVKDKSTISGRERQGNNSSESSTNDRLSNLAKDIWKDKILYKNGELSSNFHNVKNRFHSGRGFRNISSGPCVLRNKFQFSKWSRNGSFLHRRRATIIRKQNRFSIVKVTNPAFQNYSRQEQYEATHRAYPDTRKTYSRSRSSFFSRRQAYIYSDLHSTQKSWKVSDIKSIPSIYKKNLLHHPVEQKAVNDAQIYFKISGRKYQTDIKGRRLRRISSSSKSQSETGLNFGDAAVLRPSKPLSTNNGNRYKFVKRQSSVVNNMTKFIASRVIKKSVARLQQNKMRKLVKKQYCMFYNRFGKCKNGTKCPYKHDPEKIAVCTRFLRGTCKEKNCLFSHKVDRKKMPTCSFFLRGMCHKDDCPYAHVKVNVNADICKDFIKGHCPNGDKCLKKHVLECSSFMETGKCPDLENCKFYHPKNIKRRRTRSLSGTRAPFPFLKRTRVLDAKNDAEGSEDISKDSILQIRPTFAATQQNPDQSESSSPNSRRKRKFDWKKDSEQQNTTKKIIISE